MQVWTDAPRRTRSSLVGARAGAGRSSTAGAAARQRRERERPVFSLSPLLPLEPVIASVRAPLPDGGGFSWFDHEHYVDGGPTMDHADAAAATVLEWLGDQHYSSVNILGFSQGAAMVLQLLRMSPEAFGSGVALSGYSVQGEHPGDATLEILRPPVFWGRGTEDTVITPSAIERTLEWLPAHSSLTARIYEGLGHGMMASEVREIGEFLRLHAS